MSAALGLLALLLGFTFSLALDRYEQRRELVVQEANAIGTSWLRTGFVPGPAQDELKRLLRAYIDTRLAMAAAGEDQPRIDAAEARTALLQASIWASAVPALASAPSQPLAASLGSALNDMFDLASSRHAALAARIPTRVVTVLALYALIAAGILGYAIGAGRLRHRFATTALFVLLAMTIGLILDLDRSRSGAIVVSQAPMTQQRASMGL